MLHTNEKVVNDFKNHPSIDSAWKTLNHKLTRNRNFHFIFNILLLVMIAILVVLNLWGMKTTFESDMWISDVFLSMAIITAASGLTTAIISIFRFKSRALKLKTAIKQINIEYKQYKNKEDPYNNALTRDQKLLKTVSDISYISR